MSLRLYYTDSYTTRFTAEVVESLTVDGKPAVRLNGSYFYPTSGGQPHDTGTLEQAGRVVKVVDVVIREDDGAVLHLLDEPLNRGEVAAAVDWPRRFDHMQHHTGQHVLSQAFIRVTEAETIGFHMSGQSVTIDLNRTDLTHEEIRAAENLANEVIRQNRLVHAYEVDREEAKNLPLRKVPPGRDGRLRLVDIDNFDLTACGGTHVATTAEVGCVLMLKTESRGGATRVEFICGARAFADYRRKHDLALSLGGLLTTGLPDILQSVIRLQDEARLLRVDNKRLQTSLVDQEAEQLLASGEAFSGATLVTRVFSGRSVDELRQLVSRLTASGTVIALLGMAGDRCLLVFGRSAQGPAYANMGDAIRPALEALGGARGGGGAISAQGGGIAADEGAVAAALAAAAAWLRERANIVE